MSGDAAGGIAGSTADSMTGAGANVGPQATPWYSSLVHGGGSPNMSQDTMNQLSAVNNALKTPNLDPTMQAQLQQQQQQLSTPADNGGYLGALARMATGAGQTTGEKVGGAALQGLAGLLARQQMINAAQGQQAMMQNAAAQTAAQQRQTIGQGMF